VNIRELFAASKGGISVFLRAKDDKDGKLKIGYDLLGRFRHRN